MEIDKWDNLRLELLNNFLKKDNLIFDFFEKVNYFNEYFVNIGLNLLKKNFRKFC